MRRDTLTLGTLFKIAFTSRLVRTCARELYRTGLVLQLHPRKKEQAVLAQAIILPLCGLEAKTDESVQFAMDY